MRKRRIAVELFAMMIAVTGVFHGSMNVNAATKKITVDQTYENATKIKGKTKKGCVVKVKIGKKTYQSKVNKKGNYSVKVSKLKLGKKYTMTAYQKKKVYAKKSFYAETKNIKVKAFTENDHIFFWICSIQSIHCIKMQRKIIYDNSQRIRILEN